MLAALIISIFFSVTGLHAEDSVKVALLPFEIISDAKAPSLERGINTMLSHKLSGENVKVVTAEKSSKAKAVDTDTAFETGKKLSADYVVFGSVVIFGDAVSTDAQLFSVAEKKTVMSFSELGSGQADIINHISKFSEQARSKIAAPPAPRKTEVPPPPAPPEKPSSALVPPVPSGISESDVWVTPRFDCEISAMASGDVNGDRQAEIVYADRSSIYIKKIADQRLEDITQISNSRNEFIIGVDVADINGNGIDEIFVSNLHRDRQRIRTFILEWDGKTYKKRFSGMEWIFRVIRSDAEKPVLYGQKHATAARLLDSPIYRFEWKNNEYVPASELTLPEWVKAYGFTTGELNGKKVTPAFSSDSKLRVLNSQGELEWESETSYGGGALYLEYDDKTEKWEKNRIYLQTRIFITDYDGDNIPDLVSVKNEDLARNLFSRVRTYTSGRIECFEANKLGFRVKYQTQPVSGYISDYTFADIDGDGANELVYSVIAKADSIIGKKKSYIAFQKLTSKQ